MSARHDTHPPSSPSSHPSLHRQACAGLDSARTWDAVDALRGEIHGADRLVAHAAELARAHGTPELRRTAGPLRARFVVIKKQIRDAYALLHADRREEREPSPAEEWFLDNTHVVEEQLTEIEEDLPHGYLLELPRLKSGAMRGYPRVYGLCIDYLRHTDARLDPASLAGFVAAYQQVHSFTIGELWAVPIMLRLGLALTVGALVESELRARDRAYDEAWGAPLADPDATVADITAHLAKLDASGAPVTADNLARLVRTLRRRDAPRAVASDWFRAQCERLQTTPDELVRGQHLRQAADQVSVRNAITSMRGIGALDWQTFFEKVSVVEETLRLDPSGDYAAMDDATRDRYRHAVEDLGRRSRCDEGEIALAALTLARAARVHIGEYVIGDGRPILERTVGYRRRPAEWLRAPLARFPTLFYLLSMLVGTVAAASLLFSFGPPIVRGAGALTLVVLSLFPASEVAISLVNAFVLASFPPRLLPKLKLEGGVPPEHRTLVVVPALLDGVDTLRDLLERLEIKSLAAPDAHLHFALATDWTDAPVESRGDDEALLTMARARIDALNAQYGAHRFALFHRCRRWNAAESCWMGWERKRGKLEELTAVLRGATDTSFVVATLTPELAASVRYVITLDADTELPRDTARRLVGAMAHPMNRPRLDARGARVVAGHGIIQPRVGTLPVSARRSRYAELVAGPPGIDPYTTAVSDVYQDLFDEGSFVGKGIFDVDAFHAVMAGRVPENTLLSHDLFEGIFARSALATDIELLDEQPASYAVASARQHRWIRGDWQLLPWIARTGTTLRGLDRWKILDNLRRSLVAPALIAFTVASWIAGPRSAARATLLLVAVFVLPIVARLAVNAVRLATSKSFTGSIGGDLVDNTRQAGVRLVLLLDTSILTIDAIARTLYRLTISRARLLEWKTTDHDERRARLRAAPYDRRMWWGPYLSLLISALVLARAPRSLPYCLPILALWAIAPWYAAWLSAPLAASRDGARDLAPADRRFLRFAARKTWRFFETFVTAADHFLPPDNYQEEPRGVLAHRTSPTNIGLYLLSIVAARDFGFITLREAIERLEQTLGSIERLERREGHVLNWYDTTTLKPLEPQYVSTVDSGNLAAYLWTLREACLEARTSPLLDARVFEAAEDDVQLALDGASDARSTPSLRALAAALGAARAATMRDATLLPETLRTHLALAATARDEARALGSDGEALAWIERAVALLRAGLAEVDDALLHHARIAHAPSCMQGLALRPAWRALRELLDDALTPTALATIATDAETRCRAVETRLLRDGSLSAVERRGAVTFMADLRGDLAIAQARGEARMRTLAALADRAGALADAMNFRFVYDDERELFSIGYNVTTARLDRSHYDLLASEARLGSLVAIAKGDVPQKHWFRLARPLTGGAGGSALLSWSGSMFEFLMPLLVTRSCPDTLLAETYASVVRRQRQYGKDRGVPWGVSEAAYNVMDLGMTYQYRAFGVPGLGLKPGLADDLVIAPYATALAAIVRPHLAVENLRALQRSGVEGEYGHYDSIDFTPRRLPPGRASVVVKTFMAHHLGMSLVAFGEVLHGAPMQRRFHRDLRVKATELLLEERVPVRVPSTAIRAEPVTTARPIDADLDVQERVGLDAIPITRAHLLGQGELSTLTTALGEGFTRWKGLDVGRFREDDALGAGGTFLYLRDLTHARAWSAGHQPTCITADEYDARFAVDRVEIHRRDGAIETFTEVVVSPEMPVEVRRLTLTNHGAAECALDVTSYMEVVLAPHMADVAHPAFGNMFIETELLADREALLACRRPKSATESEPWIVQSLLPEGDGWDGFEHDSSRAHFLGRNRSTAHPQAMERDVALAGTTGTVLDPAFALRRRVRIPPGGRARISLVTGLAPTREAALALLDRCATPNAIPRAFELAWSDARVELRHLGISAKQSHVHQRLLSYLLFPQSALREPRPATPKSDRGSAALWTHGISGDLPILLVAIDDPEFSELLREVLSAQELWRVNGVEVDVVLIDHEPAGYAQPVRDAILSAIGASAAGARVDQRGGVFLRHGYALGDEDRALLFAAARVVLATSRGSLARQLQRATTEAPRTSRALAANVGSAPRAAGSVGARIAASPILARPPLEFDNGIGGFADDGREYAMHVGPTVRTPCPWINVVANPTFGAIVSESGSGFTWWGNSQRHRLTSWSNDATSDPPGETLYLRDDDDDSVWSPTPMPAGGEARYEVRHGQGYTTFRHARGGLTHALTVFVSAHDPVKLYRLRVTNDGTTPRHLTLFGVVEWVLGNSREESRHAVGSRWDADANACLASNALGRFPTRVAFFAASVPVAAFTADRHEIFGTAGSRTRPAALDRRSLSGRTGTGLDPCAALQIPIALAPGESTEVTFLLGEATDDAHVRALLRVHAHPAGVQAALAEVVRHWDGILGAVTVATPDRALDLLVNRWLLYQVTSCRLWGRSALYQSGGAFGFRDQLQDVMALLHARPDLAREHLLRCAARQFVEGDVQHWWHPHSGEGVRTRCSDDMLWLPYATAEYVRATGDASILDAVAPFLVQAPLAAADDDAFASPAPSTDVASLYDHCVRALSRGSTAGPHGVPRIGSGDWNDGMTRVGREGVGESVWLAWFLAKVALDFAPLAEARGDAVRAEWCRRTARALGVAVDAHAWDGDWYRRAYFDDGSPLGSSSSAECRIDAIAQSWAVLAGVGDPDRARHALTASMFDLVNPRASLMALLSPPFARNGPDPGYLGAYPPGLRENGGQYTHAALWSVQALARTGAGESAHALLSMLNPIHHAASAEGVATYAVEPYVVTADVYTAPGLVGRGGWSWYTGSAAWMYRVAVEDLLGVRRDAAGLTFDPTIPPRWSAFEVTYRHDDEVLHISIDNPSRVERGVVRVEIDGVKQPRARVDFARKNSVRRVRVVMG